MERVSRMAPPLQCGRLGLPSHSQPRRIRLQRTAWLGRGTGPSRAWPTDASGDGPEYEAPHRAAANLRAWQQGGGSPRTSLTRRPSWSRRRKWKPAPLPRSAFAGFRFPSDVIVPAVRGYLSYRDVEELLTERGVEVDHVTIYRWVLRFTPLLADTARPCRHRVGNRWQVDGRRNATTRFESSPAWRSVVVVASTAPWCLAALGTIWVRVARDGGGHPSWQTARNPMPVPVAGTSVRTAAAPHAGCQHGTGEAGKPVGPS